MPSKNYYGWDKLLCNYFVPICRDVLRGYFEDKGFRECKSVEEDIIVFKLYEVFVELTYEPETYPNYVPRVAIGLSNDTDAANSSNTVPFWYIISDDLPERRYSFWTFSREDELRVVLERIKTELLERHGKPLWLQTSNLKKLINDFRSQTN